MVNAFRSKVVRRRKVDRLARSAIKSQVDRFRELHVKKGPRGGRKMKCMQCKRLRTCKDCQVDHKGELFWQLVVDFLEAHKPNYWKITWPSVTKWWGVSGKTLWTRFHRKHARLQVLCFTCHARKTKNDTGKRLRRPPGWRS